MKKRIYRHYGATHFVKEKVREIKNNIDWTPTKPSGGFWGTPVNAQWGWKDWCESEGFRDCDEKDSFTFTLKDGARVLDIYTSSDVDKIPRARKSVDTMDFLLAFMGIPQMFLDFEEVAKSYDAIEIHGENGFYALNAWDCDSILIMNPDVVEEL